MQRGRCNAEAVIFFDDDVLSVLDLYGYTEPLQTSHLAKQTEKCLVSLYDAHTRGTDLKFPQHYRAAVMFGSNLTKDRLLQGMYSCSNGLLDLIDEQILVLTPPPACTRMIS